LSTVLSFSPVFLEDLATCSLEIISKDPTANVPAEPLVSPVSDTFATNSLLDLEPGSTSKLEPIFGISDPEEWSDDGLGSGVGCPDLLSSEVEKGPELDLK